MSTALNRNALPLVRKIGATEPANRRPGSMASANTEEKHILGRWGGILVALVALLALVLVWLRLQVYQVGYRVADTQQAAARLRQEAIDLSAEAAALDSP